MRTGPPAQTFVGNHDVTRLAAALTNERYFSHVTAIVHRSRVLADVEHVGRLRPAVEPRTARSCILSSVFVPPAVSTRSQVPAQSVISWPRTTALKRTRQPR